MKILIDAMGGDHSPDEVIKGCVECINELESEIIMIGDEKIINQKIKDIYNKNNIKELSDRIKIVNSTEVITNEESPTEAIKHKKNSSMVVGFNMLKEGKGDVFLSAGSTGAFMTGGLLIVGRIPGIDRPALCPILPTYDGKGFMLIDCGANTNCRAINLVQFAKMGTIYMKNVMNVESPRVGLLNIGAEEGKGNDLTKEVYLKLEEDKEVNFYGNIEGRDIFDGNVDIVVTDGFTGNITLKTIEGLGGMVNKLLKEELLKNLYTKLIALLLKPALKKFKKRLDYSEYGGALLLGINKPIIKCHGSAKAKIIKLTLLQAESFAKHRVVETIKEGIAEKDN
jgi:glycerol-3-phosphate acyltransferase PlsX